jgi:hypothetical protein
VGVGTAVGTGEGDGRVGGDGTGVGVDGAASDRPDTIKPPRHPKLEESRTWRKKERRCITIGTLELYKAVWRRESS